MARIAHLSDIHFGCQDDKVVDGANAWLQEQQPDLIIVSGDFTQRARVEQFKQASTWLNKLRAAGWPVLAVPGNHDIPLYDIATRFAAPLHRYKQYISNDLALVGMTRSALLGSTPPAAHHQGRPYQPGADEDHRGPVRRRFPGEDQVWSPHHPSSDADRGGDDSPSGGRHEMRLPRLPRRGDIAPPAFPPPYARTARKMWRVRRALAPGRDRDLNLLRNTILRASTDPRPRTRVELSHRWDARFRRGTLPLHLTAITGSAARPHDSAEAAAAAQLVRRLKFRSGCAAGR